MAERVKALKEALAVTVQGWKHWGHGTTLRFVPLKKLGVNENSYRERLYEDLALCISFDSVI